MGEPVRIEISPETKRDMNRTLQCRGLGRIFGHSWRVIRPNDIVGNNCDFICRRCKTSVPATGEGRATDG